MHILPSPENMYAHIQGKVQRFLRLMGWCLATQFGFPRDRFTQALMDTSSLAREERAPIRKTAVLVIVEKLVSRVFCKTKVNLECGGQVALIPLLVEEIWAEVKRVDVEITQKWLRTSTKPSTRPCAGNCGNAGVLAMMRLNDGYVAQIFKEKLLTPPKKRSAISSFFSRVGKAITKPFTPPFRHGDE